MLCALHWRSSDVAHSKLREASPRPTCHTHARQRGLHLCRHACWIVCHISTISHAHFDTSCMLANQPNTLAMRSAYKDHKTVSLQAHTLAMRGANKDHTIGFFHSSHANFLVPFTSDAPVYSSHTHLSLTYYLDASFQFCAALTFAVPSFANTLHTSHCSTSSLHHDTTTPLLFS